MGVDERLDLGNGAVAKADEVATDRPSLPAM
jgi:hypothetical protein